MKTIHVDFKALLGKTISGRFEILTLAGSGGMGTVFKARQSDLDRLVALKILDANLIAGEDSLMRFEREAKSLSLLSHCHIAGFYSYGLFDEKFPFIVMEFVEGRSLAQEMADSDFLPVERVLRIAEQIADAMAYAHRAGIVHRDLKPANILLQQLPEPDYVKIVDFGLSVLGANGESPGSEARLTKTGLLMGTPSYLSPEQCIGHRADQRSDVYALGCIMYQMLCSEPPFVADNPVALLHMHVNEPVQRISQRCRQKLSAGLDQIILKSLAKEPEGRYQSMDELREDLLKTISGELPGVVKMRKRLGFAAGGPVLPLAAGSLLILGLAGIVFLYKGLPTGTSQVGGPRNAEKVMQNALRLSRSGDEDAARNAKDLAERFFGMEEKEALPGAKLRLQLAEQFYKEAEFRLAAILAFESINDLKQARKEKKLESVYGLMVERASTKLAKLKLRSLKLAMEPGAGPADLDYSKAFSAALIAGAQICSSKIEAAIPYVDDLARILEKFKERRRPMDGNLQNVAAMLLAILDTPWSGEIPYELRSKMYLKTQLMARSLVEAGVPGENDLLWRQAVVARGYVGVGDFQSSERELKKWLTMLPPDSAAFEEVRLSLAGVQEVLGKPQLSGQVKRELAAKHGESDALRRLARGQIWAGQNYKACQTLDLAMAKLDKKSPDAMAEECLILEDYAWGYRDAGEYAKAEPYLRKLVELQSQYSKASPGYTRARNELAKCLDQQNKVDESLKIDMANPIGSGLFAPVKKPKRN